jgi:hypothetical protein
MARVGGVTMADFAVLLALRPHPGELGRDLMAPHAWVVRAGADGAAIELAATALWCTAAWLALGLLACLGARLPGAAGRCGHRIARAALPSAVYRVVAGAAGLGLLLAPLAAGAASAQSPAGHSGPRAAVSPEWPTDSPLPAPAWPTGAGPLATVPPRHSSEHRQPQRPPQRAIAPDPAQRAEHAVIVRTDDSLWSIAAASLPGPVSAAKIARSWPRWYAVNRAVIGANPAFLVPGQTLHAPTPAPEERS